MRVSFSLPLTQGAFRLEPTVLSHGWYQIPPFGWDWDRKRFSIALRPGGDRSSPWRIDATERLDGPLATALEVELESRARREPPGLRALAAGALSRALGLDHDVTGFHEMCRLYPPLGWVPGRGAGRLLRGIELGADVVSAICGTNIQWNQAVRCLQRIGELAPEAPGSLRPFPSAAEILAAGEPFLRERARVGYRAVTIVRFCEQLRGAQVDLQFPQRSPSGPELRRFFGAQPGIGPVTARFLATLYGRADELAVDSLVLRYVGDKYHGGKKPTVAQVQQRYARFGPWQALAYWFEFLGDVDPRTWRGWNEKNAASA